MAAEIDRLRHLVELLEEEREFREVRRQRAATELNVRYVGGHRLLPIVELREAA